LEVILRHPPRYFIIHEIAAANIRKRIFRICRDFAGRCLWQAL